MNERIRALAKEAGIWRQHYDLNEESTDGLEKFAELIVQECCREVGKYNVTTFAIDGLKEHFDIAT